MTVEVLQILAIVAFIASGVLLLAALALFFLLDVPKLYGDVSGRTAQKAIEAIRKQNEETGNKAYKPSAVNQARGKLTDKISNSGRTIQKTSGLPIGTGTEKLSTGVLKAQAQQAAETTLLEQTAETTLLVGQGGETTVLTQPGGETTVLTQPGGETTVLTQGGETTVLMQPGGETTLLVGNGFASGQTSGLSVASQSAGNDSYTEIVLIAEARFAGTTEIIE